jgi:hypothetical protein
VSPSFDEAKLAIQPGRWRGRFAVGHGQLQALSTAGPCPPGDGFKQALRQAAAPGALWIEESAELPAIDDDLNIAAAKSQPATFSGPQLWSLVFGIAGSLAGLEVPEAGAGLGVTSYIVSALPTSSDAAMSESQTTYDQLQTKFATMITEIDKQMIVQNQLVRSDAGLLQLLGQLRERGTWALDVDGMGSAANQGVLRLGLQDADADALRPLHHRRLPRRLQRPW